jgi:hypothetical protein
MWWAADFAKKLQAIQDRWRALRHLIRELKNSLPTQMAIPLQMDESPKTVGRCK